MDQSFWLDNVLAACTALSALVLVYGCWLCVGDAVMKLLDWLPGRSQKKSRPAEESRPALARHEGV